MLHTHFQPAPGQTTFIELPPGVCVEDVSDVWRRLREQVPTQLRREAAKLRMPPKPKLSARERYLKRMGAHGGR